MDPDSLHGSLATGLFVVYNDSKGLGNELIGPQNRSFAVKYNYQFDILN